MMKGDRILLAHGGGGSLTRELIEELFLPAFDNPRLRLLEDSAVLSLKAQNYAFTTDSYVVKPYFFPGVRHGERFGGARRAADVAEPRVYSGGRTAVGGSPEDCRLDSGHGG